MFDRFNVCDNTKVYDIIKVEREEMDAFLKAEKEEKDTRRILTDVIMMSPTSMVFSLWLNLVFHCTVPSTTKTHFLNVFRNNESIKT